MNQSVYIVAGITLVIAGTPVVQAQAKSAIATVQSQSSSTVPSNIDSLSRQIGAVEVERSILLSKFSSGTPVIQKLDQRYAGLLIQLKQFQPSRYLMMASSAAQAALSEKIGTLEVERAIELTRFRADTPVIKAFDQQLLSLVTRLKQLQPKQYRSIAASATQRALQAKIADLRTVYRQEAQRLIPSAPSQRSLQAQISTLNQRLAEIRKSV